MVRRASSTKNKPEFRRQESRRYKRLDTTWRKPKGIDNHQRKQKKGQLAIVKIGYGSNKKTRGLHPSGYRDNLVYNNNDLNKLDPKIDGLRIAHSVGRKKRMEIVTKAIKMRFKIYNARVIKNASKS